MVDPTGASEDEVAQLRRELGMVTRQAAHLERALASNRRIGVAVGIVMERHKVTADDAFGVLVKLSMERNEKLRDVAERIVGTGELPRPG
ncbi:ANTAR domain-containing protein [Blastococcus xanthinilyticus]|uniref:ANTAR domain-containing protein n=1 Tax=Blastococcus xanthinilyticus TaxID=1564164 RepID=A0A5S5CPD1_9ACTN|nr:ANTAR domain-containing protein [Blastococcus xanthinilyticus]TYP81893.1 ANTAR domain-containing protein [Blastococcus xanthinilyticus]